MCSVLSMMVRSPSPRGKSSGDGALGPRRWPRWSAHRRRRSGRSGRRGCRRECWIVPARPPLRSTCSRPPSRATCQHGPALIDLAGFRADRGDAPGALRLLVQAGVEPERDDVDGYDDDDRNDGELLWDEVEGFAMHRPRPMARRNDPCPCGSGRKYKVCHLGREMHSLDDRAGWLYLKASRFLRDRRPLATEELAGLVVDEIGQPGSLDELADGPFLRDIVLHEEGVFDEFLAARDGLLPDDEALLAAQWALVDRGVFEVLHTTGTELDLRDLARGDRIRVVNTHPSNSIRA